MHEPGGPTVEVGGVVGGRAHREGGARVVGDVGQRLGLVRLRQPTFGCPRRIAGIRVDHHESRRGVGVGSQPGLAIVREPALGEVVLVGTSGAGPLQPPAILDLRPQGLAVRVREAGAVAEVDDDVGALDGPQDATRGRLRRVGAHDFAPACSASAAAISASSMYCGVSSPPTGPTMIATRSADAAAAGDDAKGRAAASSTTARTVIRAKRFVLIIPGRAIPRCDRLEGAVGRHYRPRARPVATGGAPRQRNVGDCLFPRTIG